MRFRSGARLDTSQVQDHRGRRVPGGLAAGAGGLGIIGVIIAVLVSALGGGGGGGLSVEQLNQALGGATSPGEGDSGGLEERCRTGAQANESRECRIVAVVNSLNEYWTDAFAAGGGTYEPADTLFIDGPVSTACGPADARSGPFYCPGDRQVYVPLDFFDLLASRFGAEGGPFAEAYVVAHEYGHHVQTLLGLDRRVGDDRQGATSALVRLELQADCFAGVWAGNAERTGVIESITDADIALGLDAAAAVGDDRIQQAMQGRADPDTFTHGTAEQRQRWFTTGYRSADAGACDTWSASRL